ncbi:uncharacterized protein [Littorina saxatilis]|uniref:uncharacterized protein n=1 Tax=Littorina saxatilis TaxID=31220 RepID=UPI0038B637BD
MSFIRVVLLPRILLFSGLNIHEDCSGNRKENCRRDAVCDSNSICRIPEGGECYQNDDNLNTCVAGATCLDYTCRCNNTIATLNNHSRTCEPREKKAGGECKANAGGSACEDRHAKCTGQGDVCQCDEGYARDDGYQCKLIAGQRCTGEEEECIAGTECDGIICKIGLGSKCSGATKDLCIEGAVCDNDRRCRIDRGGNCSGQRNGHCRLDTLCDNLYQCRVGHGSTCAGSSEVCVAGASCVNNTCTCAAQHLAVTSGAVCFPAAGRVGGECDGVDRTCQDPWAVCGELSTCRCTAGLDTDHRNYSCVVESESEDDTGNLKWSAPWALVIGLGVASVLVAFFALAFCVYSIRRRADKKDIMEVEHQRNDVRRLSESVFQLLQEENEPIPQPGSRLHSSQSKGPAQEPSDAQASTSDWMESSMVDSQLEDSVVDSELESSEVESQYESSVADSQLEGSVVESQLEGSVVESQLEGFAADS